MDLFVISILFFSSFVNFFVGAFFIHFDRWIIITFINALYLTFLFFIASIVLDFMIIRYFFHYSLLIKKYVVITFIFSFNLFFSRLNKEMFPSHIPFYSFVLLNIVSAILVYYVLQEGKRINKKSS